MNKLALATIVTALGSSFVAPQAAQARHHDGDDAVAVIGGFIGGVIVGSAIEHGNGPVVTRYDRYDRYDRDDRGDCGGHFEWISVREWVPGRWVVSYDRRGHRCREFRPGYYSQHQERVWIDHRHDFRD